VADDRDIIDAKEAENTSDEDFLVPETDIYETDDGLVLLADMPGVGEGGVAVSVDDDTLTIMGRVEPAGVGDSTAEVYIEYRPTPYRRVFTVSRDIDTSSISGNISQGVLRLTLPKSDRAKVMRIPIQPG